MILSNILSHKKSFHFKSEIGTYAQVTISGHYTSFFPHKMLEGMQAKGNVDRGAKSNTKPCPERHKVCIYSVYVLYREHPRPQATQNPWDLEVDSQVNNDENEI